MALPEDLANQVIMYARPTRSEAHLEDIRQGAFGFSLIREVLDNEMDETVYRFFVRSYLRTSFQLASSQKDDPRVIPTLLQLAFFPLLKQNLFM